MIEPSRKHILLVEDDDSIRHSLLEALGDEGYDVHGVSNGKEALEYLSAPRLPVALILLDTMMPVMDGFAFRAAQVKDALLAAIPTILYSADGTIRERAQAIDLPFLQKPFKLAQLFEALSRHIL